MCKLLYRCGLPPLLGLLLGVVGCSETSPPPDDTSAVAVKDAGRPLDPAICGVLQGQVTWEGDVPTVPALQVYPNPLAGVLLRQRLSWPNPNAPLIDPESRGVKNAVVFLRGIDPAQGKAWDQPPVRVEQRGVQLHVLQGESDSPYGFVRRGDRIEMVSRDPFLHLLHAGGSAFFTLAFPVPDQPLSRVLKERGTVELTSGAGYFWMRGYLFVADHPYYTRTNALGRFTLPQVPPGNYELVCWMPSWLPDRQERDPESGLVARLFFQPPVEKVQPVALRTGESATVHFQLSADVCQTGRN